VTAAQRLRLVLALGVINLILATAALSLGIFGIQTPPSTAGGPTPETAFASPPPTAVATPAGPGETAAATAPAATSTPGVPEPTPIATSEPTATPTTEPSATPVPVATVAPTQAPPVAPVASRPPPILAAANPPTSAPTGASDVTGASSTTAPVDMAQHGQKAKQAKPVTRHGKVVHHKPTSHRQGHRDGGQQASADKARRNHKSGRRLRRRPNGR
jgi:outer membrane biosynthesis protein TonB